MQRWQVRPSAALVMSCLLWAPVASASDKEECSKAYVAAQTQRMSHELRSARATLSICARAECSAFMRGQIVKDCSDWLEQVNASIPTVVFALRTPTGEATTNAQIFIDGAGPKPVGEAAEVDPGQHLFTFTNGRDTVEKTATILEGSKEQVISAVLANLRETTSEPNPSRSPSHEPLASVSSAPPWWTVRTAIPLGVGAAGIVTGAVFGLMALHDKGTLDDHCPGGRCDNERQNDIDALHTHSWIANVAFGVGIAGIASGLLLYSTDDHSAAKAQLHDHRTAVRLVPWAGGGAALAGTF